MQERFILVEDSYDAVSRIKEGSLVILFNTSLYLNDRKLVNFYEEQWMPLVRPLFEESLLEADPEISNEYKSSNDWDAFYTKILE